MFTVGEGTNKAGVLDDNWPESRRNVGIVVCLT